MLGDTFSSSTRFSSLTIKPPLARASAVTATAATVSLDSVRPKSSDSNTLYKILRVNHTASQAEIKAACRSLAKPYHPDTTTSSDCNGRDFIEIHNAYGTLSDPVARATYDSSIRAAASYYHVTLYPNNFQRNRSTSTVGN